MTTEQFQELSDGLLGYVDVLLNRKRDEYADGDIFSNFREGSEVAGIPPEAVAFNYDLKHIISIKDIVNGKECTPELWREKIGDYLAYGLIMNALMEERFDDIKR